VTVPVAAAKMDVISDSILLPLEDSIQRLKRINQVDKSPNDAAHVYKGALAFFCHLKKDQAILFRYVLMSRRNR
jgi:hypothetical protein